MKNIPFLSIVIPTFNSDTTLQKCLTSIISQSFSDFEVLIIDGVSNDNTLKIAERYYDSRIKIISEPDNGIYDAMNKGIKLAKGEWLYFLGSDDALYSCDILKQIHSLTIKTNKSIIYGDVMLSGFGNKEEFYDGEFSIEKLLNQNICHQSIFYKRSIFDKIGNYNIDYTIHADWDFNLRCRSKFKFQYIDYVIAFYSAGGYSQTGSDDSFTFDYWEIVTKQFLFQFYKKDFHKQIYDVFKRQCKNKRISYAFVIFVQLIIFHYQVLFSKIIGKLCSH